MPICAAFIETLTHHLVLNVPTFEGWKSSNNRNHCIEIYDLLWTLFYKSCINQTAWVETQTNELIASLYEAASFLRSQYSFSQSRYYLCFMKYEGLLLGPHEPVTGLCSELPYSSSLPHIWFFMYILVLPRLYLGLGSGLFLFSFLTEILISFLWNIWCRLQIVKLLITQLSLASCYFLSFRSVYCPRHPTGRHPHWHITTKWLLPFVYRQHIGPVFVKCHLPIAELDILPWEVVTPVLSPNVGYLSSCDVICHIPEKWSSQMDCCRSQIALTFSLFVYSSLIWETKIFICGKKQPEFDSSYFIVV